MTEEVTPETALKAVEDAYEIERRCSHEVLRKTLEGPHGRIVFRCQCGFVVEGKTDRPEHFIAGDGRPGTATPTKRPEKPSPIDGLMHSSVWGKINDLQARVERLETLVNLISRSD